MKKKIVIALHILALIFLISGVIISSTSYGGYGFAVGYFLALVCWSVALYMNS